MFYYLSHILTEWIINIKKLDYDEVYDKIEIRFRTYLHAISTTLVCLLFAWWIGILIESIIVLIVIQIIRTIIGGLHWNLDFCLFLTCVLVTISAKVSNFMTEQNISLFIIFLYISFIIVGSIPYFKDKLEYDAEKLTYKKYSRIMIILLTIIFICDSMNILTVTNSIAMAFVMIIATSKKWFK